MHEHDLDLIAALADGSAGEAGEAAEARALVETCPVCRAEYEAQTEVIAWLAAAPSPVMTDLERAGLHRAVRSGLGSETTPAPSAPWWQRLGYVAAGLLVVAGLFGVLQNSGMMMGGGDESASLFTTTAADGADAPAGGLPFVAEDAEEAAAPTTTAAASADTMAAAGTGDGSCEKSHIYMAAGVYAVKVTVTDKDGESDTEMYEYVVVYDPNGAFVTGGGWINSPAGAYAANPALMGKANFGFVSKYKKGANVPTGSRCHHAPVARRSCQVV